MYEEEFDEEKIDIDDVLFGMFSNATTDEEQAMQKFRKTLLSEIIRPDGSKVKLYSSKKSAAMIPVKLLSTSKTKENRSASNEGGIRLFYNWLLEKYNSIGNTNKLSKDGIYCIDLASSLPGLASSLVHILRGCHL